MSKTASPLSTKTTVCFQDTFFSFSFPFDFAFPCFSLSFPLCLSPQTENVSKI
ncbi:hypothetical protein CC80DRAFT_494145 [Byssothecium circinans]|uniref:Uncharacterized protein n=1 Tax=Byssothecium circinans TaxID=147558 RepID=A0A6A5TQH2_9PLEO|nr:hypothetical protein CC80DRAFT_494145 [Byssothecium circinans]